MKKLTIFLFFAFMLVFASYGQNDFLLLNRNRPLIDVEINGVKAAMLIDTGSSINIICTSKLSKYGVSDKVVKNYAKTINGVKSIYNINGVKVFVKNRNVSTFYSVDIEASCKSIEAETGIEIAGILGTPAIKELKMVIDLSRGIVTINKKNGNTALTD